MDLTATFTNRDFSARAQQPEGPWQVESCSWAALGGPERAVLAASRADAAPAACMDLLRCPVELYSVEGGLAWWGYIHAVELRCAGVGYRMSLEELFNRVRVDYRYVAGSNPSQFTAEDAHSQSIYGQKELFLDIGVIENADRAQALAESWLARTALPGKRGGPAARVEEAEVRLELRGWWSTLGWRVNLWNGDGVRDYSVVPLEETNVGAASSASRGLQAFAGPALGLPWSVSRFKVSLRKYGSPTDALHIGIYQHGDSGPQGAELDGVDIAASSLTTTLTWVEVELRGLRAALTPGVRYCFIFQRTGALNASHYYRVGVDTPTPVTGMFFYQYWNGSTWVQRSPVWVAVHQVWGESPTGELLTFHAAAARGGQFLNGVCCGSVTGRYAPVYSGQPRTHLREMIDLLRLGTAAGERLLAAVTPGRGVRIHSAPPVGQIGAVIGPGGVLLDPLDGQPFPLHRLPVGTWAAAAGLEDLPPFFIERVVWDGKEVRVES